MNSKLILMGIIVVTAMSIAIANSIVNFPSAKALSPPSCAQCAKDFAPGQEAKIGGGTCDVCNGKDFAPGQLKKSIPVPPCSGCNDASQFAPGQLKKQPSTTTFG